MVATLEVYMLKCQQCGKPERMSRLKVKGNLREIEANHVCKKCRAAPKVGDAVGS